jgi:hypothetical protein
MKLLAGLLTLRRKPRIATLEASSTYGFVPGMLVEVSPFRLYRVVVVTRTTIRMKRLGLFACLWIRLEELPPVTNRAIPMGAA